MASYHDCDFPHQTQLARFVAAQVIKDFVLKREQRVGNDLFVRWILFRLITRKKEIVSARKEQVEIFRRFEVKALKTSKLIEQAASDDENIFVRRIHRMQTL